MKIPVFHASQVYFSSDWHLSHANIIKYDNRPFASIREMDEAIINNFSKLKETDILFFLGDLAFEKDPYIVLQKLKPIKCRMFWILGNHDHHLLNFDPLLDRFERITPQLEIRVKDGIKEQYMTLNHYAMRVWNHSHHGAYHLYGHSHHSLKRELGVKNLSFDVGCNGWDYKPLSYYQVVEEMKAITDDCKEEWQNN